MPPRKAAPVATDPVVERRIDFVATRALRRFARGATRVIRCPYCGGAYGIVRGDGTALRRHLETPGDCQEEMLEDAGL